MEERHLQQAEKHIALGERLIQRQQDMVATLERDGLDTIEARRLLANFEHSQALHLAYRDQILEKLAASS